MFACNDKVRTQYHGWWIYGFTTVCLEKTTKVMFEFPLDIDLDYTYYPNEVLEKVTEEEYAQQKANYEASR